MRQIEINLRVYENMTRYWKVQGNKHQYMPITDLHFNIGTIYTHTLYTQNMEIWKHCRHGERQKETIARGKNILQKLKKENREAYIKQYPVHCWRPRGITLPEGKRAGQDVYKHLTPMRDKDITNARRHNNTIQTTKTSSVLLLWQQLAQ